MANFDAIRPIHYQQGNTENHNLAPKPRKRRMWKWAIFILLIAAILIGGFYYLDKTNRIFTKKGNIFTRVTGLFISQDKPLIGEDEGLVNILLMGIGGEGHDGAHLTDTMIVASINTRTHEVVLVSIPRDFGIVLPKVGYNKINAAYAYAYKDDPSTAGEAAITAAETITGFKIPYFAVIDFRGFVKAVDDVGGVDVTVDHTFTDATFPNDYPFDTKGYIAPVTFTAGPQHMNGQRALIFARSRHSENANEGSDFARSERQKKIIIALKEKVLALNLTKLTTINNLLNDFTENFRTNLEPWELKRIADIATNTNSDNIYSYSLDPDGVLICSALVDPQTGKPAPPPQPEPLPTPTPTPNPTPETTTPVSEPVVHDNRIYVVLPCAGKTFADIQSYLTDYMQVARLKKEGAVVEVQDSTGRPYVLKKYNILSSNGITEKIGIFKGKLTFDNTVLYDNSHGTKPKALEFLKTNFNPTVSDVIYPTSNADFVIIIGRDSL